MDNIIRIYTLNKLQQVIDSLEQYFKQLDNIAHTDIQIYLQLEGCGPEVQYYIVNTPNIRSIFWLDDYRNFPVNLYTSEDMSEFML